MGLYTTVTDGDGVEWQFRTGDEYRRWELPRYAVGDGVRCARCLLEHDTDCIDGEYPAIAGDSPAYTDGIVTIRDHVIAGVSRRAGA